MISKITLTVSLAGILIFAYFSYLAKKSAHGSSPGLSNGLLQKCPGKPNCVCSDVDVNNSHYIEPLFFAEYNSNNEDKLKQGQVIWQALMIGIKKHGGVIVVKKNDYLAATFTSRFFGFVDDFEARLDIENSTLHFRSASRVGTSDLGINRKRVLAIQDVIIAAINAINANAKK